MISEHRTHCMVPSRLFATFFFLVRSLRRGREVETHKTCWHVDCSITFFAGTRKSLISCHRAHIGSRTVAQKISKCALQSLVHEAARHWQQQQQPHQKHKQINAFMSVCVCVYFYGRLAIKPPNNDRIECTRTVNRKEAKTNEEKKKIRWKRSRRSHLLRQRLMCSRALRYFRLIHHHHSIRRVERRRLTAYECTLFTSRSAQLIPLTSIASTVPD